MELIDLLAVILATYRLSSLLVEEAGPLGIFQKVREAIGITHDEDGQVASVPANVLGELFGCLWCMSVWMAGLSYLIWWLEPIPIYILAASGGVLFIDNVRK